MIRKLKYMLNRDMLLKIYTIFIRPSLEYASQLWDGCGVSNAYRLEKLQLAAARIVTGRDDLYFETGLEPLKLRRTRQKNVLMYK